MAVGKTVKQQRNVSVAADAALGVMKAADYLQQTLAEICGRNGITTDQYGMLRILRDAYPTGFARRPHLQSVAPAKPALESW